MNTTLPFVNLATRYLSVPLPIYRKAINEIWEEEVASITIKGAGWEAGALMSQTVRRGGPNNQLISRETLPAWDDAQL